MAKRNDIGRRMPGKGHGPLSATTADAPRFGDLNGGFTLEKLLEFYGTIPLDKPWESLIVRQHLAVEMVRDYHRHLMFVPHCQLLNDDERSRFLARQLETFIDPDRYRDAYLMFIRLQECHVLVSVTEQRVVIINGWQANFINYLIWTCSDALRKRLSSNSGSRHHMAEVLQRLFWIQMSPGVIVPSKQDSLQSEIKKQADPNNPHKARRLIDKLAVLTTN